MKQTLLAASSLAPRSTRNRTTGNLPVYDAAYNEVTPYCRIQRSYSTLHQRALSYTAQFSAGIAAITLTAPCKERGALSLQAKQS